MKTTQKSYVEKFHMLKDKDGCTYFYGTSTKKKLRYTLTSANAMRFRSEEEALGFLDEIRDRSPYIFVPVFEEVILTD